MTIKEYQELAAPKKKPVSKNLCQKCGYGGMLVIQEAPDFVLVKKCLNCWFIQV